MNLKDKNIILGVCGSIAAYKSPIILRELVKAGAKVNCVITNSAKEFVTGGTLANLSKNPVISDLYDYRLSDSGAWHVHLAHQADAVLVAPTSATTIGKLANGICDNALTTLILALPKDVPVILSPAMDYTMWENPIVQDNLKKLESYGYQIIDPEEGELSSGLVGKGRLPEIPKIIEELNSTLAKKKTKLSDKKIFITAGPTVEKIDDVRYISNFSTGKMGYALAEIAAKNGAEVTLVSGPVNLDLPKGIKRIDVESAEEMLKVVEKHKSQQDIFIMTAAVSDFKPKDQFDGKIKKENSSNEMTIELTKNPDILQSVGTSKTKDQFVCGFALESSKGIQNAKKKLEYKNADMIVLNYANRSDEGFGSDTNKISIITKGIEKHFDKMTKKECAEVILEFISNTF